MASNLLVLVADGSHSSFEATGRRTQGLHATGDVWQSLDILTFWA